jgi:hypothetical protein
VDLLHDRVPPHYEAASLSPERVLTHQGREYGGRPLHYSYELYSTVQQMEHRNTKVHMPKITGVHQLPPGA